MPNKDVILADLAKQIEAAEKHFEEVCFAEHAKRQVNKGATSLPYAEKEARQKLDALCARRSAISAGQPDPAAPPPPVYPRATNALKKPFRITPSEPDENWKAVAVNDNDIARACHKAQQELNYGRLVHAVENVFEKYSAEVPAADSQAAYTRGAYGALMQMFAAAHSEILALHQVTATQLKQIYERVDELERGGSLPETIAARREVIVRMAVDDAHRNSEARRAGLQKNLEARIEALEQRPAMKYCGVYNEKQGYVPGDFVTHHGSLFHAECESRAVTPGTAPAWKLAVKRGRDARDPRDKGATR